MSFLKHFFGKKSQSLIPPRRDTPQMANANLLTEQDKGMSLYWGPTKLELKCLSFHVIAGRGDLPDLDTVIRLACRVVPRIEKCWPRDTRISRADCDVAAMKGATEMLNERALSDCSVVYGPVVLEEKGKSIHFFLALFIAGGRKGLLALAENPSRFSDVLTMKYAAKESIKVPGPLARTAEESIKVPAPLARTAKIAVLFDIEDLGGGSYGQQAWDILLTTLAPDDLRGCVLSHGDTDERIPGRKRPYCWAIALDCVTPEQVQYVTDTLSRSSAKGLMPGSARFAQGHVLMQQPFVPVARIDEQGHFVLLDDAYVWLLVAADKAAWRHKIEARCVGQLVRDWLGCYGMPGSAESNLVLARSFVATGGPEVVSAIEAALRKEKVQKVKEAYEQALTQIRTSESSATNRIKVHGPLARKAKIAVLFDIEDLGGGDYGQKAWDILLSKLSPADLGGCALSHGDTDERIPGRNRPYCWAIALDCVTPEQVQYVTDSLSKSSAKGLMTGSARFAQGHVLMQQPLITVGRIDEQGHFVLLDHAYVWVLIAADKATWRHKIDAQCVGPLVREFLGWYELGSPFHAETKLVLARSFVATGGPEVVRAIDVALRKEEVQKVIQAYEQALMQIQSPESNSTKRIKLPGPLAPNNEFDQLVEELIRIGRAVEDPRRSSSGFLRKGGKHPRARQIGERLNIMGYYDLMSKANRQVERILGPLAANELSCAWDGIGGWLH